MVLRQEEDFQESRLHVQLILISNSHLSKAIGLDHRWLHDEQRKY